MHATKFIRKDKEESMLHVVFLLFPPGNVSITRVNVTQVSGVTTKYSRRREIHKRIPSSREKPIGWIRSPALYLLHHQIRGCGLTIKAQQALAYRDSQVLAALTSKNSHKSWRSHSIVAKTQGQSRYTSSLVYRWSDQSDAFHDEFTQTTVLYALNWRVDKHSLALLNSVVPCGHSTQRNTKACSLIPAVLSFLPLAQDVQLVTRLDKESCLRRRQTISQKIPSPWENFLHNWTTIEQMRARALCKWNDDGLRHHHTKSRLGTEGFQQQVW
eukprot:scaffold426_cov219-Amphora_coffeaeformis.AAC.52